MATLVRLAIALWIFLSACNAIGGLIGWYQLRTDHRRASLYLSRILIAESFRSVLAFVGIYYGAERLAQSPIYVALSTLSVILLSGAIWGWLLYLRGLWNGGGWPELLRKLKRPKETP
jgi:hypothetical protein